MPLFVLLLIPKVRRFEVIQFHRIPEGATVNGVLEQVKQRSSNPEFSDISFVGLYCPKTETKLLLSPSSPAAASAKNRRPRPSSQNDLTAPSINDAPLFTENHSATAATAADPIIPSTITGINSAKKHEMESEPQPPTTPQTQSTTPETPQSANSEPFPSPGSQAPSNSTMMMTATSAGDFPPTTITIEETTLTSPPIDTSPILDLSGLGQLLVAIPEHHRLKEIMKQCHKIMSSPAFGILTNGIDFLNQSGNSQIRQELQSIQDQKLAKTLSETLTQQHEHNHEINKAYEDQAKDLEARKAAAAAMAVSTITPTSADVRSATYTSRPDQHGLSPLDQMRVQQNQQRAAEREIKRSILNPYQNSLEEAIVTATGRMTPTDDPSNPGSFISPSQQKRLLIEAKKKAELDAVRQQGRTQSVSQSPFFASSPTASSTSSIGPGVARSYSLPLTEVNHRTTRTTLTASIDAPPLTESLPEVVRVMSLPPQVPLPEKINAGMNTSQSELNELKSMGLAHSVKSRLVQVEQENMTKSDEYQEQQQQLETRKAQGSNFQPSRGSESLSAADVTLLRLGKEKQELRQKERENMGYYLAPPTEELLPENTPRDWRTTGQVLTTMGTDSSTTKEWQASNDLNSTKHHSKNLSSSGKTGVNVASPSTFGHKENVTHVEQPCGCACVVM